MARLTWDGAGDRVFETGVDRGVLYPRATSGGYPEGFAWNGLTAVTESPTGAEPNDQYADNIKYLTLISNEEFAATIEAFTYPDEFAVCNGEVALVPGLNIGQQSRRPFGMTYRTKKGNDIEGQDWGYKLHLIYGALAAPSEKAFSTINDSPEAITFSWEISTTPIAVNGHRPTAILTLDSTLLDADALASLEDILYGTESEEPRLPEPDELLEILTGGDGDNAGAQSAQTFSQGSGGFGGNVPVEVDEVEND